MTTARESWEAVFFDIGGVVVSLPSIRQGYVDYLEEFCADHGLDPESAVEEWRSALGEHFKSGEGTEYMAAMPGYRKAFRAIVDGDVEESDWRPGFEAATAAAMEPEPHAVETIRALDDAGLYLGIVSDIDTWEAHRMLDAFGVDGAFDGVTTSEDVGYKKPDRRMFEDALAKSETAPGRTLMVGDRYDHDMQGATERGIQTVAYNGAAADAVADAARAGHRVLDDPTVDYAVDDLRDVLDIVGVTED